jgi:hypothetical protein
MKVWIGPYKEDDSPRKEEIAIHDYDTWNMDHTLALIALPMLKQLKETKHGVPYMVFEDMPEHLKYNRRQYDQRAIGDLFNDWDDFDHEFQRQIKCWDWMLDEMIWAMEQVVDGDSVEHIEDIEYHNRIANGLKLFGKYYRSLWD